MKKFPVSNFKLEPIEGSKLYKRRAISKENLLTSANANKTEKRQTTYDNLISNDDFCDLNFSESNSVVENTPSSKSGGNIRKMDVNENGKCHMEVMWY